MSLAVICSIFLSACDVQAFPDSRGLENSSSGASITNFSEEAPKEFTGELISDGVVRLEWPRDPSAVSYIIMENGRLSAIVPASELSTVTQISSNSILDSKFTIDSVNAADERSEWVTKPTIIRSQSSPDVLVRGNDPRQIEEPPVVDDTAAHEQVALVDELPTDEQAPPAEQPASVEQTPTIEQPKPYDQTPVEQPKPYDQTPPVEQSGEVEQVALVDKPATNEQAHPAEQTPTIEQPQPYDQSPTVEEPEAYDQTPVVEQPEPYDQTPSVEQPEPYDQTPVVEQPEPYDQTPAVEQPEPYDQTPPVEQSGEVEQVPDGQETSDNVPTQDDDTAVNEETPIVLTNLAPDITDTSYNCDPIVESIRFTVGQTDYFTLSVTDESPLTLSYDVDISKQGVVNVKVDNDGVFTISALQTGDTFLWLSAEDDAGLVDEYELRVMVQ